MKSFLAVLLIALGVAVILPTQTYAFWPFDFLNKAGTTGTQTKFPEMIQKMIDKFKLNPGEVQKVMEETQTEKQQEMKTKREARLEEAVKAGIITEEQKTALLNKETEWQQKQQQLMQERQQWMEQSGIDFQKLAPYWRGFDLRGFGGGGRGMWK